MDSKNLIICKVNFSLKSYYLHVLVIQRIYYFQK